MTCPNLDGDICRLSAARMTPLGCSLCQREWTDGPPTADRLTPTIKSILALMNGAETIPIRPRGLGDTLASILHAVGIRKRRGCGCGRRQALLNRLFPYR